MAWPNQEEHEILTPNRCWSLHFRFKGVYGGCDLMVIHPQKESLEQAVGQSGKKHQGPFSTYARSTSPELYRLPCFSSDRTRAKTHGPILVQSVGRPFWAPNPSHRSGNEGADRYGQTGKGPGSMHSNKHACPRTDQCPQNMHD